MNDLSEVFSHEAEMYNKRVSDCKKRLKELGFVRIGSGMGRTVWAKEKADYVLKLPIDYPARNQNSDERENYESQTENRDRLAVCRTLSMNGIDILMMERVIPFSEPDEETGFESMVPAWAENIDCKQVGKSVVDGRICAFDYAGEISGNVFGEKSKIDEMEHDEIVKQAL